MADDKDNIEGNNNADEDENEHADMDAYLEERAKMDDVFKDKFAKTITVMFTDLKGSTTITETEGDLATRMMLKKHNDTITPLIENNNGILVKTMGDGTMSYFKDAQDAVKTACAFQHAIDAMNIAKEFKTEILVRIGINTGEGIVEKDDIYGDVVNVASRFESSANGGEIYMSESTYDAMSDKTAIYSRYIKTTKLKGKKDPFKIYKVFWKEDEIEEDKAGIVEGQEKPDEGKSTGMPPLLKLALIALIPVILVFLIMKGGAFLKESQPTTEKRSLSHSATDSKGKAGR